MEYSKIVNSISTVFEAQQLMRASVQIKDALFKVGEGEYEKAFREAVPLHLADVLRDSLPDGGEDKIEYLEGLHKALEKLPVVVVTMAFHPTEGFLEKLVGKLRQLMEARVIVDVKVRRLILGGAKVEYKGRVGDYSVKSKLSQILSEHGNEMAAWGADGKV